jgi:hypothetical protein
VSRKLPRSARRVKPKRPPRKAARKRQSAARPAVAPVTARELRALRREIEAKASPMRWNPRTEDVERSVAQLVLTIVEFLRKLMERRAIRRVEQKTLTRREAEAVGLALMRLEKTIREIGARFGLSPEDLNLDLGPAGKLM